MSDPRLDLAVCKAYAAVLHNEMRAIIFATETLGAPTRLALVEALESAFDKANAISVQAGVAFLKEHPP